MESQITSYFSPSIFLPSQAVVLSTPQLYLHRGITGIHYIWLPSLPLACVIKNKNKPPTKTSQVSSVKPSFCSLLPSFLPFFPLSSHPLSDCLLTGDSVISTAPSTADTAINPNPFLYDTYTVMCLHVFGRGRDGQPKKLTMKTNQNGIDVK